MNADELKRVRELLDHFGEGSAEDRRRRAQELDGIFCLYDFNTMPSEVKELWREFRWRDKYTWYEGEIRQIK